MKDNRLAIVCALLAATLGACTAPMPQGTSTQSFEIDRTSRPLPISAGVCRNGVGAACENRIEVSPECVKDPARIALDFTDLKVDRKVVTPIQWTIVTPDWEFASEGGIEFYAPGVDLVQHSAGTQRWVYIDKAITNKTIFSYRIRVRNRTLGITCERDPTIANDW